MSSEERGLGPGQQISKVRSDLVDLLFDERFIQK